MEVLISDLEGVSISIEEQKKVADALDALTKDPHAPRAISVSVTLHVHNEYPKAMYRGKETVSVKDKDEESARAEEGFGDFVPEAPEEQKAPEAPQAAPEAASQA